MGISIKIYDSELALKLGYVPERFLREIDERGSYFFAALADRETLEEIAGEGGEAGLLTNAEQSEYPVGVALFTRHRKDPEALELKYIFVPEIYRKHGIGAKLLRVTEGILRDNGYRRIFCETYMDEEGYLNQMLYWRGYEETGSVGIVCYVLADLLKSAMGVNLERLQFLTSRVRTREEVPKAAMSEFVSLMKSKRDRFDVGAMDKVYTRFYFRNNEVQGYIRMEEVDEDILQLKDLYVKKKPEAKYALPALIADILSVSGERLTEEALMILRLDDRHLAHGVQTVFGESLLKKEIIKYSREL